VVCSFLTLILAFPQPFQFTSHGRCVHSSKPQDIFCLFHLGAKVPWGWTLQCMLEALNGQQAQVALAALMSSLFIKLYIGLHCPPAANPACGPWDGPGVVLEYKSFCL
jgi:hypothetical protein